jgi:ArsR family transcriptional regulator
MREFVKVMKALSDPNRIKILKMLQRRWMCVCELEAALGIAQPTVSKHLKVLEEAGLVGFRKEGLWVNYMLADGRKNAYTKMMLLNLQGWLNEEQEIQALIDRLPAINRETLCRK